MEGVDWREGGTCLGLVLDRHRVGTAGPLIADVAKASGGRKWSTGPEKLHCETMPEAKDHAFFLAGWLQTIGLSLRSSFSTAE